MKRRFVLGIMCVFLFGGWYWWKQHTVSYPEVDMLSGKTMDFGQLSVFFTKLSQTKGAVYAFEVLRQAPLPPNTDMHLLGHVVGDELFKQKGIEGMSLCTQDFRNACSHSIVVGYFLAHGEEGLGVIADACRNAPGGIGAYTMCFHGLGHGVLAAVDYDFPRAVGLCKKTGTPPYNYMEAAECTGGAVMEIISGGFHNKKLWEQASASYLSRDEPLLPCTAPYMPQNARPLCYEYLTAHLVTVAGGSLDDGIPSDDVLRKAFSFCASLPEGNDQNACYRGFGKEFIVLVHNRDTRTLADMSEDEMKTTYKLCALAQNSHGEQMCLTHALDSLYWGGENTPKGALLFCQAMPSSVMKDACFLHLAGAIAFYTPDQTKRKHVCNTLPQAYQKFCYE